MTTQGKREISFILASSLLEVEYSRPVVLKPSSASESPERFIKI